MVLWREEGDPLVFCFCFSCQRRAALVILRRRGEGPVLGARWASARAARSRRRRRGSWTAHLCGRAMTSGARGLAASTRSSPRPSTARFAITMVRMLARGGCGAMLTEAPPAGSVDVKINQKVASALWEGTQRPGGLKQNPYACRRPRRCSSATSAASPMRLRPTVRACSPLCCCSCAADLRLEPLCAARGGR